MRGTETETFYLFNAGLVHVYMRMTDNFLAPSQLDVPNWNFKSLNSARVNCSIKSSGSLSRFLDIALLKSLDDPQMRASNFINDPSELARTSRKGVVWLDPLLRALTEHGP